jgi:hypothetical protein
LHHIHKGGTRDLRTVSESLRQRIIDLSETALSVYAP